ncbi:MAG: 3-deoxy-D-manno-octulosonic acid transferase [Planctomycetia bacterium]|nr:3-deoxy-D-manno-octulosonic acid transferase [Planctomycetia bacterium]
MARALDALYSLALLLFSPWLAWRAWRTGRYRSTLGERLLGPLPDAPSKAVWFHGVSVGEIAMLRQLVAAFRRRHPMTPVVVSSTTDTGLEQARKHFPDLCVFVWPFDFSWAVGRVLDRLSPSLVVLGESELWPNFLLAAQKRGVPVVVVNGRMSPRSVARYSLFRPLVCWTLRSLRLACVQSYEHAAAFLALGAMPGRVHVTGNIKYDGAGTDRTNAKTLALGRLLGLRETDRVFVAGSTQPGEERAALDAFRTARERHPSLRLIVAPRAPERFDEVAALVAESGFACVRRSTLSGPLIECPPVVVLDTLGELAAVYGLAEVAFVGGSLDRRRGGQSMIEPAGFGAAVLFGPHVWNFRHTAESLLAIGGAYKVEDAGALTATLLRLLDDEEERRGAGVAARTFVLTQQGATTRTLEMLDGVLALSERKAA